MEKIYWRKLDSSAKVFPLWSGKKYSSVFRISVVLKEKVNPEILKTSVINTLDTYSEFKVKMKAGFFWYYLEKNNKEPIIQIENDYPCKYIDYKKNNGYLFKVTYYRNKINIDIFHSLTDGRGGIEFFKEIIYRYLESKNKNSNQTIRYTQKEEYSTEDSYIKNYNKKIKSKRFIQSAYILKGRKLEKGEISTTHYVINLKELKKNAEENDVSLTTYLAAMTVYSIYQTNYKIHSGKNPIKICIPVDLKNYIKSNTILNFFSYMTISVNLSQKKEYTFDEILRLVEKEFKQKLVKEEIEKTMTGNVKLGRFLPFRIIPLPIKYGIMRIVNKIIKLYATTTLSNIGKIEVEEKYKEDIEEFLLLVAPDEGEKIKCSICSFENNLVYTITNILEGKEIESKFFEILEENDIEVKIERNDDYVISKNK